MRTPPHPDGMMRRRLPPARVVLDRGGIEYQAWEFGSPWSYQCAAL
jgi:hypothetical protein